MTRAPFGPGMIVLGGGALLLSVLLFIGFLLPGEWEAEASARLDATPSEVFAFLDSPGGWQMWTPWPDSGLERVGPDRGPGASIRWDDPEVGSGSFTIGDVRQDESVTYAVEVAGAGNAVMRTQGSVTVVADSGGVLVRWREEGDLGRNPLMGFWALSMERAQSAEMSKGLDRLGELIRTAPAGTVR